MDEKKQIVKSTDWLTKGYSEEEIARIKAEAVEEAEKEIRNKQIEEMAKVLCKNALTEYCASGRCSNPNCLVNAKALETLYNAGYRKQSEGEWIAKDNFNGRCTIATCSNCRVEKAFPVLVRIETISTLYPYCQKCGAHMKGGVE